MRRLRLAHASARLACGDEGARRRGWKRKWGRRREGRRREEGRRSSTPWGARQGGVGVPCADEGARRKGSRMRGRCWRAVKQEGARRKGRWEREGWQREGRPRQGGRRKALQRRVCRGKARLCGAKRDGVRLRGTQPRKARRSPAWLRRPPMTWQALFLWLPVLRLTQAALRASWRRVEPSTAVGQAQVLRLPAWLRRPPRRTATAARLRGTARQARMILWTLATVLLSRRAEGLSAAVRRA